MTPEAIQELIDRVKQLRTDALFDDETDSGTLPPVAEQLFILALNDLDTAVRHLTLALYARRRGE